MNEQLDQFALVGYDFAALGVPQQVEAALAELPVDTLAMMPWVHTPSRLAPPTNTWFSGLAFGSPSAIFASPISYLQTDQGFVFGLPHVTSSRHAVSGSATSDIDVNVGACAYRISAYDQASVTIEFLNEIGRVLGHAVIARGVPYVSYTAAVAHDVALSESFAMTYEACATAVVEDRQYGLVTTGMFSSRSIRLQAGQFISLIAFPQFEGSGVQAEPEILRLARHASFPVLRTQVTAQVLSDEVVTTIRYLARENGPVAVVRLPHQGAATEDVLGVFTTVNGTVPLVSAKVLTWRTPRIEPRGSINLDSLLPAQRETIAQSVAREIAAEPRSPQDTYFGGKALYREANLVELGLLLGVDGASQYALEVEERFLEWINGTKQESDEKAFIFDDVWSGVVGREASYGADMFNDHLTQWGYFLRVATILGSRNPALLENVREVMNALVFDIAVPVEGLDIPVLRPFDAYGGHSWASGTADSDEGNSQESASEAVAGWNAVALWAQLNGTAWLYDLAVWLLSLEAQSTLTYWTNFDEADPAFAAYQHSVVQTVWGGKRDSVGWFNGDETATLGVVVLPMSPVSGFLGGDADRVMRNLSEIVGYFEDYSQTYGDYLLMYRALAGAQAADRAWELAVQLPDDFIDDGNSRAFMLAWIGQFASVTAHD